MVSWTSDHQKIISELADEVERLRGQWVFLLISADTARRKWAGAGLTSPNGYLAECFGLELGDAQSSADNARIRYEIALAKMVDASRYFLEEGSSAGGPYEGLWGLN